MIFDKFSIDNPISVSSFLLYLLLYNVQYSWFVASSKYSILNADPFTRFSHVNTIFHSDASLSSTVAIFYCSFNQYVDVLYVF